MIDYALDVQYGLLLNADTKGANNLIVPNPHAEMLHDAKNVEMNSSTVGWCIVDEHLESANRKENKEKTTSKKAVAEQRSLTSRAISLFTFNKCSILPQLTPPAYAETFFSPTTLVKTASWPVILRPSARSNFAPSANLLISSLFSAVTT